MEADVVVPCARCGKPLVAKGRYKKLCADCKRLRKTEQSRKDYAKAKSDPELWREYVRRRDSWSKNPRARAVKYASRDRRLRENPELVERAKQATLAWRKRNPDKYLAAFRSWRQSAAGKRWRSRAYRRLRADDRRWAKALERRRINWRAPRESARFFQAFAMAGAILSAQQ